MVPVGLSGMGLVAAASPMTMQQVSVSVTYRTAICWFRDEVIGFGHRGMADRAGGCSPSR